jgi:hypothetical protein
MAIQISGTNVIDNSRNIVNGVDIAASGNLTGGIVATQAEAQAGTNNDQIMTPLRVKQFFDVQVPPLPPVSFGGGFLICRAGGTAWIVAPSSSQVSRSWYLRDDANTRAQQVSGCTGWFVPTIAQLLNPGYACRCFWDSFSSAIYWSSTENNATTACCVNFTSGSASFPSTCTKASTNCVRAFRCVTY